MKRVIYSVGLFLVVLFLCSGFFLSYQVTEMKERIHILETDTAKAKQEVSALSNMREQDFIFERYEEGKEKGVLPGFCLWNKSCDFQAGKRKSGIREGIYFAGRGRLCGSVPGRKGTGI